MERISKHLSYQEAIFSETAIRKRILNIPDDCHVEHMKIIAERVFEPVRKHVGKPIYISSFYRSRELNTLVGGSVNSQHTSGQAIDMIRTGFNKMIFDFIKDNLSFDQLIWEYGNDQEPQWVHVSYFSEEDNRNQAFRIPRV